MNRSHDRLTLAPFIMLALACCDGKETGDSSDPPPIESVWYEDGDGDGYGDPASSISSGTAPDGWVDDATDCDDSDDDIHPGAAESCNGIDWAGTATLFLGVSLVQGAPAMVWAFFLVFSSFLVVWSYWRFELGRLVAVPVAK